MNSLPEYYAARAAEYERIYAYPERQSDLARLAAIITDYFPDRTVLEMACGTGYWTVPAALHAKHVVGIDINEEVLAIARTKPFERENVDFVCADLYAESVPGGPFDAALVAHWWSHIDRREQRDFLAVLHQQLAPGARVLYLDNRYVEGSSTPVSREDEYGNTYQTRGLDSGKHYEVMKNFPRSGELAQALEGFATDIRFVEMDYYWYVTYSVS